MSFLHKKIFRVIAKVCAMVDNFAISGVILKYKVYSQLTNSAVAQYRFTTLTAVAEVRVR